MDIDKGTIIGKVRTAIDEILPEDMKEIDSFWKDQDEEIWQAVQMAAEQLCLELPREYLEPRSAVASGGSVTAVPVTDMDGEGYIEVNTTSVAPDYLALYELKMAVWKMGVTRVIQPGTVEAMQQTNAWTCGTPWKPKVMEVRTGSTIRLYYWTVKTKAGTGHTVERLTYIERPKITTDRDDNEGLSVPLIEATLPYIIYRAGRLVMTAKKETQLAEEFDRISRSFVPTE